jgi:hypothetical protein
MALTPSERSLRAKIASHAMHAQHDSSATTTAGRAAFLQRFLDQVDETLPEAERQRRAQHLLKAHMARLALAFAKARRRRAGDAA